MAVLKFSEPYDGHTLRQSLEEEWIVELQVGTTIHDIGKIYCPAEILNRPGELTDDD